MPAWFGLIGGAAAWYAAHEASFFLVRVNCVGRPWIVAAIHTIALLLVSVAGFVSFHSENRDDGALTFANWIGIGAALLFAIVIVWQGAAGLIYNGCER